MQAAVLAGMGQHAQPSMQLSCHKSDEATKNQSLPSPMRPGQLSRAEADRSWQQHPRAALADTRGSTCNRQCSCPETGRHARHKSTHLQLRLRLRRQARAAAVQRAAPGRPRRPGLHHSTAHMRRALGSGAPRARLCLAPCIRQLSTRRKQRASSSAGWHGAARTAVNAAVLPQVRL